MFFCFCFCFLSCAAEQPGGHGADNAATACAERDTNWHDENVNTNQLPSPLNRVDLDSSGLAGLDMLAYASTLTTGSAAGSSSAASGPTARGASASTTGVTAGEADAVSRGNTRTDSVVFHRLPTDVYLRNSWLNAMPGLSASARVNASFAHARDTMFVCSDHVRTLNLQLRRDQPLAL